VPDYLLAGAAATTTRHIDVTAGKIPKEQD